MGFGKHEFWDVNELWKKWGVDFIEQGILIEKKYDGRRFSVHIDKKTGTKKIVTEDRLRDRGKELSPILEELVSKIKANSVILDAELVAYDTKGKKVNIASDKERLGEHIPREDTAAFTIGSVPESLMDSAILQVHDVLFKDGEAVNDQSALERIKLVNEIVPSNLRYSKPIPFALAKTRESFIRFVNKYRSLPGSEGVVVKAVPSKYPIKTSGENRISAWAKLKNLKEIDVMVVRVIPKKSAEGKTLPVYMYESAYLIPSNQKDKFLNSFEKGGKWYAPIGRTYSTSVKCSPGDIITVMPIRVREYEKQGKRLFTWMFPYFKEKRTDKTEPDTLTTVERIAEIGTGPSKASTELTLENCPFWMNASVCPFNKKFKLPEEWSPRESDASKLKYPIKCRFASIYKCIFCKDYYYDTTGTMSSDQIDVLTLYTYNSKMANYTVEDLVAKYMEYPPNNRPSNYVIQRHSIGDSQHFDFRFQVDGYLVGWTIVGFSKSDPATLGKLSRGKGFRAETKARQPPEWLRVEGVLKPGTPGGREAGGGMTILSGTKKNKSAKVVFGCFPEGEIILSNPSVKKIEEFEKGDRILDKNGRFTLVKETMSRYYRGKVYHIKPKGLPSFTVTGEHPLLVDRRYAFCKHGRPHFCARDCFCKKHGCKHPIQVKREWIEATNLNPERDSLILSRLNSREGKGIGKRDAYLTGLWIADGWLEPYYIAFALTEKDIEKLKDYLPKEHLKIQPRKDYSCVRLRKKEFKSLYTSLASLKKEREGKRGFNKRLTNRIFNLPENEVELLIEGWLDGDGYINRGIPRIHIQDDYLARQFQLLSTKTKSPWSYFKSHNVQKLDTDWDNIWFSIEEQDYEGKVYNLETEDNSICTPVITHNSQKTWFHEYFIKDGASFPNWTRLVVRGVKVGKLDPKTKKAVPGKYELMWRFLVAADQKPYAISSRARRKNWKPPKGIVPFPVDWAKKAYPKDYEKWLEYMGEAK